MDGKPAAKITLERRFKQISLQGLTKYNLPWLFTETTTAIAENRIHTNVAILDGFPRPRTVTGIIALQGWIGFNQIAFGIVWDLGDV
jgi:hypothetical protein